MLRTTNNTVVITQLKELESTEPVIIGEYITLLNVRIY
jgi:hypothetical protein